MKIETKEKIEIFKQVIQGLFKLLVGVSILLSSIGLYNHFKNPKVEDKPKEPEVSESDCEDYVKEYIRYLGDKDVVKADNYCDYIILGIKVSELSEVEDEVSLMLEKEKDDEEKKNQELKKQSVKADYWSKQNSLNTDWWSFISWISKKKSEGGGGGYFFNDFSSVRKNSDGSISVVREGKNYVARKGDNGNWFWDD